jgi:hypothetical protein
LLFESQQESASSATQKVKDGVNNLFDGLSKALSTENSPENGEPVVRKSVPKDAVFNRSKVCCVYNFYPIANVVYVFIYKAVHCILDLIEIVT